MNFSSYLKKLLFVTVPLALLTWLVSQTELFSSFQSFSWVSLIFFFVVSCGVYLIAANGISSSSSHRFVAMISGSFTGKLLICVFYILIYALVVKPSGKPFFIIPFFVFYIVFTVLEVVELVKLSKNKTINNKH